MTKYRRLEFPRDSEMGRLLIGAYEAWERRIAEDQALFEMRGLSVAGPSVG